MGISMKALPHLFQPLPHLCLMCVLLGHAGLWRHRISATALLLRDKILIGERLLLFNRHIAGVHLRILWHSWASLLGWQMLRGWLLGGLDRVLIIDAILIATSGFGSVQTSLDEVSKSPVMMFFDVPG